MAKPKGFLVRISDVFGDIILDVRKFSDETADNAIAYALQIFSAVSLCNVYVWDLSRELTIVSLHRDPEIFAGDE